MEQLKMYLLPEINVPKLEIPNGFSISKYKNSSDQIAWTECCRNGALIYDEADPEDAFHDAILTLPINLNQDIFFLDFGGEHIATATCYINENNEGDLHMVGMREEFRGKGLSKYITYEALRNLNGKPVKYILLTTDEFRKSAIRTYLNAGFLPVKYDVGMVERWESMLADLNVESVLMLNDDASVYGTIYRKRG